MAAAKIAPLVVIVGETASGKSALALKLAQEFNGEVICADSWTVYRGFDIGTAKPTLAERRRVPHHLLDIADPAEGFSAPEFKWRALAVIADIAQRGKLPILVGGTGLYIDSVLFDYSFLPAGQAGQREELNRLTLEKLLELAKSLKLDTAQIDTRNKRRVVRLIETNGRLPVQKPLRPRTLIIGATIYRELLQKQVEQRVDTMLAGGLENEVRQLSEHYGWNVEPMKGIGYREFKDYFAGSQDLAQTRERIIKATLDLAKKQRTWFKRNKSIHWVAEQIEAVELTTTFLNK